MYDSNEYVKDYIYIGKVESLDEQGRIQFIQRNKFVVGQQVEAMLFDGTNQMLTVRGIWNDKLEAVESAPHPKEPLTVDVGCRLPVGTILRYHSGE